MRQSRPYNSFGVIGGMGPASTVRFLELVIAKYRTRSGAIRNSDFPQITLYTIPDSEHMADVPDLRIVEYLDRAFTIFEVARAAFAVAPCNTVHQFLPIRGRESRVQVLSIINAVLQYPTELLKQKRVLFLSTRQTRSAGIYKVVFAKATSTPVFLSDSDQNKLDDIIQNANSGGMLTSLSTSLSELVERYDRDAVLLACTELSLLLPLAGSHAIVDSLEALAEATYLVSSGQRNLSLYDPIQA